MIPDEVQKVYWSIGAVSKLLNVPAFDLRFWQKKFNIKLKTNRGYRKFTEEDILLFRDISEGAKHLKLPSLKRALDKRTLNEILKLIA
jgi:DNA-binding transcriptional MerR regulator